MKLKMLKAREAALDGVNFVQLEEGGTYEVPDFLAESYLERGIGEEASAKAELDVAEPVADESAPSASEEEQPAEATAEEGESGEGEPSGEEPAGASPEKPQATPLEELVANNTRAQLNAQAKNLKIPDAEKLKDKQAVAEAILAARG
jgi:hypothetical protein